MRKAIAVRSRSIHLTPPSPVCSSVGVGWNIRLHKNATTTPRARACIQQSGKSKAELGRELGIDPSTVRRWRGRDSVEDRSHAAHRLQTTMDEVPEWLVVELRRSLLLPLDDLLRVTREYINPKVSRSGLDRCLRRHGVGKLAELMPEGPPKSEMDPGCWTAV